MERRRFISLLAATAAATPFLPTALARGPRKESAANESASQSISVDSLQDQQLKGLSKFGDFRLLYFAGGPDPTRSNLVSVRTGTGKVEWVKVLDIAKGHSVVLPVRGPVKYAVLPELDGPRALVLEVESGEVLKEISLDGSWFPGHGCFSHDGKVVYLPQFDKDNKNFGQVVARSLPDLEVLRVYDSGSYAPHGVALNTTGKILYVGHYGRRLEPGDPLTDGAFTIIDIESGKLLPSPTYDDTYVALCHIEAAGEDIFISTRNWVAKKNLITPLYFAKRGDERFTIKMPAELKNRFRFNFSIRYHQPSDTLAITHVEGKMVTFWRGSERKYLGLYDCDEGPLGLDLTPDGKNFIINTKSESLIMISATERKEVARSSLKGIGWSPHIHSAPV